jgi:P27 family predicted phage terminase small subunit
LFPPGERELSEFHGCSNCEKTKKLCAKSPQSIGNKQWSQAMRGRKPLPTHLRLLRGNPGKRAIPKHEIVPDSSPDVPAAPAHVSGYALEEWNRLAPQLHRFGLLTSVDLSPFAAYCLCYQRWRQAEEGLKALADRDPLTCGIVLKQGKHGIAVMNPLVYASARAAADMVRYAAEFGFTPAARARIAAGVSGPPMSGKFDGLLA